jgi:CRISPR system Cascade subunit CasD
VTDDFGVLVLRLAAPVQSWSVRPEFNYRRTHGRPTKSGVLGLLAAAEGRARGQDITDLLQLAMAVRVDQPGRLLRDYHTLSDHRGGPLASTQVNAKGVQKATSPAKSTHITERYYLEDAAFVVALQGPAQVIGALSEAVRAPAFPLALGRRSCPPTQPILLPFPEQAAHSDLEAVLRTVPWQAGKHNRDEQRRRADPGTVRLPATIEDLAGDHVEHDVPSTFALGLRTHGQRRVRHTWLSVPTGLKPDPDVARADNGDDHDPFALLGW